MNKEVNIELDTEKMITQDLREKIKLLEQKEERNQTRIANWKDELVKLREYHEQKCAEKNAEISKLNNKVH